MNVFFRLYLPGKCWQFKLVPLRGPDGSRWLYIHISYLPYFMPMPNMCPSWVGNKLLAGSRAWRSRPPHGTLDVEDTMELCPFNLGLDDPIWRICLFKWVETTNYRDPMIKQQVTGRKYQSLPGGRKRSGKLENARLEDVFLRVAQGF